MLLGSPWHFSLPLILCSFGLGGKTEYSGAAKPVLGSLQPTVALKS